MPNVFWYAVRKTVMALVTLPSSDSTLPAFMNAVSAAQTSMRSLATGSVGGNKPAPNRVESHQTTRLLWQQKDSPNAPASAPNGHPSGAPASINVHGNRAAMPTMNSKPRRTLRIAQNCILKRAGASDYRGHFYRGSLAVEMFAAASSFAYPTHWGRSPRKTRLWSMRGSL